MPSSVVPFAALLIYSPRGTSHTSRDSQQVCYAIKAGRETTVRRAVVRLVEMWRTAGMADFFGDDVTLVPVPRSAPLVPGALWPADVVCREMLHQGLAGAVEPMLKRVRAVPKAHFSRQGERPDVARHRDSMEVDARILAGTRITLVDDVITQGRTLYAGSTLVQEAAPTKTVRAFGLVRTMGFILDVERILDPCIGTLTPNSWGGVDRQP